MLVGFVFLVAGVVYIPFHRALLLLFKFPMLDWNLDPEIRYHLFKEIASEIKRRSLRRLRNRICFAYGGQANDTIQALLIHWSHGIVLQLQPRSTNRTLNQINCC